MLARDAYYERRRGERYTAKVIHIQVCWIVSLGSCDVSRRLRDIEVPMTPNGRKSGLAYELVSVADLYRDENMIVDRYIRV